MYIHVLVELHVMVTGRGKAGLHVVHGQFCGQNAFSDTYIHTYMYIHVHVYMEILHQPYD